MTTPEPLTSLISHLPEVVRGRLRQPLEVEKRLAAALDASRARWPDVELEPARYITHLGERLGDGEPDRVLDELFLEDLYCACACAASDPRAIAAFHSEFLSSVETALIGFRLDAAVLEEVKAVVEEEVLVGSPGHPPLIASYRGTGPLRSWLRVIAVRVAGRLIARTEKEQPVEEAALEAVSSGADPELDFLKRVYRNHFRVAFAQAVRKLSVRERNLLRQHHLDGLSVEKLGALYRVHRATAARWVARAREVLLQHTRAAMRERIGVSESELDSIMRLIESQLLVTMPRFLRR